MLLFNQFHYIVMFSLHLKTLTFQKDHHLIYNDLVQLKKHVLFSRLLHSMTMHKVIMHKASVVDYRISSIFCGVKFLRIDQK